MPIRDALARKTSETHPFFGKSKRENFALQKKKTSLDPQMDYEKLNSFVAQISLSFRNQSCGANQWTDFYMIGTSGQRKQ